MSLTAERLRELLLYDEQTGVFTWKTKHCSKVIVGRQAGTYEPSRGYVEIVIDRKSYKAHRLAFLYMRGRWPADQVDHRDGHKTNNSWQNLREATDAQNQRNKGLMRHNTSGVHGVSWSACKQRWRATIRSGRRLRHIGYFEDLQEAAAARRAVERDMFGQFAPSVTRTL